MTTNTINDSLTIAGNGEGTLLANRYRVVRQLGQGGMGSVWLAEDTQLDNKPFAIKMLPSILVSNKRAYNQLKAEALVAMKLTHPNIVTLRAFEENNGNPFLVMDYIDGQTLDDYLAEHGGEVLTQRHRDTEAQSGRTRSPSGPLGGLPEADVLRILRPIAAALDYAHGEGVVHRDVKPANVMIRKDGHPFILDFGIAREIQETLTRVTGKLSSGTLLYMSPEQLMGEQPRPAQDIYSFAAMAYECLKGEPPFSHGQIEFQIMNKQPAPLATDALTGKAAILAAGVMAGLAKKPEDRPATCAAVLEGKDFSRVERVDRVDGIGGARRPAEPVGSRVPCDRMGGSRSRATAKIILVAALLAALVGGAWWFVNARAARSTGTTGVPPVATNDSSRVESECRAKDGASEIRAKAQSKTNAVECISANHVFENDKKKLLFEFKNAENLFTKKQWTKAAQGFSNYVTCADKLLADHGEWKNAVVASNNAEVAKGKAEQAEAQRYVLKLWTNAVEMFDSGNAKLRGKDFPAASNMFAQAAEEFHDCEMKAQDERERQEKITREKKSAEYYLSTATNLESQIQSKITDDCDEVALRNRKNNLKHDLDTASASIKQGLWVEAAQGFSNCVTHARKLLTDYDEWETAVAAKKKANDAKTLAEQAGVKDNASKLWGKALESLNTAEEKFKAGQFPFAVEDFDSAAKQFNSCVEEGRRNRERENAIAQRDAAMNARKEAERAEAMTYAKSQWNKATNQWERATVEFEDKRFTTAIKSFADALRLFKDCVPEACKKKREYLHWAGTWICSRQKTTVQISTGSRMTFIEDTNFVYEFKDNGTFTCKVDQTNKIQTPGKLWGTNTSGDRITAAVAGQWAIHDEVLTLNKMFFTDSYKIYTDEGVTQHKYDNDFAGMFGGEFLAKWLNQNTIRLDAVNKVEEGKRLTETKFGDYETHVTYDADGRISRTITKDKDGVLSVGLYSYDADGRISRNVTKSSGVEYETLYSYDADGTCRSHMKVTSGDCESYIDTTESPRILRRR